jgi:phage terminase large subunit-like protein
MLAKTNQIIDGCDALAADKTSYLTANGKERLSLTGDREYIIKAPNGKAGRGPSADHVDMDELREHRDREAWNALRPTIRAIPRGQLWGFSNAGDKYSVLLNDLQDKAVAVIERGAGDDDAQQTFLAEWSAEKGCELTDVEQIAQANPGLGYLFDINEIWSALENDTPNGFRTEVLCQRVDNIDSAFDMDGWAGGADPNGSLKDSRDRISLGVDVSLDGEHITASITAELADGRYRLEPVGAWDNTQIALRDLHKIVNKIKPRVIRWFRGPASAFAADIRGLADDDVDVQEISGTEVAETCMEFADLIRNRRILHGDDPLFNAQIEGAGRKRLGDAFVIVRASDSHVDAVYAMAGAVHGARNLPAEVETVAPMLIAAW